MENTSHELKKKILMETLRNFHDNFWRNLQKIEGKPQLVLEEKLQNPEEILKVIGVLLESVQRPFKA